ncbi:MAG: rod shape-determining protein MreC [Patescibacteria group bacterium]|nr:rod shape-determining protein MreC [Patescibacteria group bacterium]
MFKKNQKLKLIFFTAVIILLVFLLSINKNNLISANLSKFLNPIQSNSYSFSNRLNIAFVVFLKPDYFKNDNEQTKIIQEIIQNEKNKILLDENKKLKQSLNFLSDNNYLENKKDSFISVYITGRDPLDSSIFIINKGFANGLEEGMPVIVENGILIGKLVSVEENFSHFILITDNRSEISVSINNEEKISGLARGNYNLGLKMELIPIDKKIKEGDIVVTSGAEKFMPKGLIVGKVLNINKKDNDIFQNAELLLSMSLDNIDIVTIFKKF